MKIADLKNHQGVYEYILSCIEENDSSAEISFTTSGTTGIPKSVTKNILHEYSKKSGRGTKEDIWLSFYEYNKWASISVILHTIKNASGIIFPDPVIADNIAKVKSCTHIAMTPSIFSLMLSLGLKKSDNVRQVTFGGEYAKQKVLDLAAKTFPNARISHVYATSESGDIMSCSDGLEGYPIDRLESKQVSIVDDQLYHRGKPTSDMWEVVNDRILFSGRSDDIVNVGGTSVNILQIEDFLIEEFGLANAVAKKVKVPILQNSFILEYVGDLSPSEARDVITKTYSKYHVPIKFIQVEEIKLSSSGKKVRR